MADAESSSTPAVQAGVESPDSPPTHSLRELLEADWALQHSDNPEFASQSGNHSFDAKLQDISPAAFQRRLVHNRALLEAMGAAAEHASYSRTTGSAPSGDDVDGYFGLNGTGVAEDFVAPTHAVAVPHADSAGGGGGGVGVAALATAAAAAGMSVADFAMLRQSIADETRALELGCHLFPVNSIGYGGVHNNFLEALDWLGPEDDKGARDANLVARLEAFPEQCDQ